MEKNREETIRNLAKNIKDLCVLYHTQGLNDGGILTALMVTVSAASTSFNLPRETCLQALNDCLDECEEQLNRMRSGDEVEK